MKLYNLHRVCVYLMGNLPPPLPQRKWGKRQKCEQRQTIHSNAYVVSVGLTNPERSKLMLFSLRELVLYINAWYNIMLFHSFFPWIYTFPPNCWIYHMPYNSACGVRIFYTRCNEYNEAAWLLNAARIIRSNDTLCLTGWHASHFSVCRSSALWLPPWRHCHL